MLVLTRKLGEKIIIDGKITLTVVEIVGKVVRLGIDAPKAVHILREELIGRQCHSGVDEMFDSDLVGNETVTTLFTEDKKTIICKQLSKLPPVASDWQQSCKQPRCPHYCNGECCNSGRQSASAPCPFDGKELLLEDAEPVNYNDAKPLLSRLATPAVPRKG